MSTATVNSVSPKPVVLHKNCPACGHAFETFFELPAVPVNSCILVDSREEALAFPRGDIALGFCAGCGFVLNTAFDPARAEYDGRYEETQAYSGTFNRFHKALAHELVDRLDLHGKHVIEIGCGKGEFLALLCELGGNSGLGYDPGFDAKRPIFAPGIDAKVIANFYREGSGMHDADFLCCKMTLEHIPDTAKFVAATRESLRPSQESVIFFQIPEAMRIFKECAFEDVYYEHCSYFTPGSLARLFRSQGFDVRRVDITYGGQYLTVEGGLAGDSPTPPLPVEDPVAEVARQVRDFAQRFEKKVAHWRGIVQGCSAEGPVLLWGSGSKAVSFLRALDLPGAIEHVVDINPHRHGHYMPGTGQLIVGPEEVAKIGPRAIIVMNSIYLPEIRQQLASLGVQAELFAL